MMNVYLLVSNGGCMLLTVTCAVVLEQAMARLGKPYPREAERRNQILKKLAAGGKKRAGLSPFADLDERFLRALQARPGGFDRVAASYARS